MLAGRKRLSREGHGVALERLSLLERGAAAASEKGGRETSRNYSVALIALIASRMSKKIRPNLLASLARARSKAPWPALIITA